MSTLDDIYLSTVYVGNVPRNTVLSINLANDHVYQSLKAQIKDLMLELIGENELIISKLSPNKTSASYRNKYRVELRKKVEEL